MQDPSNTCGKCGQVVPEGQTCQVCNPSTPPNTPLDDLNDEIDRLLFSAHLSRNRRDFATAAQECQKVLLLRPENVEAHMELSEIYLAQGQPEEAIRWCKMALDIDPANAKAQAFLQGLESQAVPRGAAQGMLAGPVGLIGRSTDQRLSSLMRLVFVVGLAIVVIAVIGLVFNSAHKPKYSPREAQESGFGGDVASSGTPPRSVNSRVPDDPASTPEANTDVAPTGATTAGTPQEMLFLSRIKQYPTVMEVGAQVHTALVDPRNKSIVVVFLNPGKVTAANRRDILIRAKTVAQASFAIEPQATTVSVRADADLAPTGPAQVQIAFTGDIIPSYASGSIGPTTTAEDIQAMFTDVFWHPSLKGSVDDGR